MKFAWKKDPFTFLWVPTLDSIPLVTIHYHSKALSSFLSDRKSVPQADYDIKALYASLYPN